MSNVTMSIDDELLKKVRKIAVDQDSTLSEMYRIYLSELARKEDIRLGFIAKELDRLFAQSTASSAGQKWNRDDLHER